MRSFEKGLSGEKESVIYLEKKGYEILARRFRSPFGEVDIVAKKEENLIFVEVKTWDHWGIEALEDVITKSKKERIQNTGLFFLDNHPEYKDCHIRFDLIFLSGTMGKFEHWESAF